MLGCTTLFANYMYTLTIIGGHGFWDKGDVYTGGVPKKDFAAAFSSQISFPPGCKNFFSAGGFC